MQVICNQNLLPKFYATTFNEIASLLLEHGVFIRDANKLVVAEALGVGNVGEVGVAFLAVFADNKWFIDLEKSESE